MQYQVPQFIDVEDKNFGSLTLKQFVYLAGGAGLSFVLYVLIGSLFWSFIPIVIVMSISISLAFYRVYNHFPLINIVESAFKYYSGSKLYIWRKEDKKPTAKTPKQAAKQIKSYASIMVPKVSDSKLKDLAWSLDIQESVYSKRDQR